jgi:hypothetical protein
MSYLAVDASSEVVTKDVSEYSIEAGIAAHFIREPNHNLSYKLNFHRYFH